MRLGSKINHNIYIFETTIYNSWITDIAFDNDARMLIFVSGQFKIGAQIIEGSSPAALFG